MKDDAITPFCTKGELDGRAIPSISLAVKMFDLSDLLQAKLHSSVTKTKGCRGIHLKSAIVILRYCQNVDAFVDEVSVRSKWNGSQEMQQVGSMTKFNRYRLCVDFQGVVER